MPVYSSFHGSRVAKEGHGHTLDGDQVVNKLVKHTGGVRVSRCHAPLALPNDSAAGNESSHLFDTKCSLVSVAPKMCASSDEPKEDSESICGAKMTYCEESSDEQVALEGKPQPVDYGVPGSPSEIKSEGDPADVHTHHEDALLAMPANPYAEWDELFGLSDYWNLAQEHDYSSANGECLSYFDRELGAKFTNGEFEYDVSDCNSSSSDLFDVYDNPIAHSDTTESDDVLSSHDSESVVSEADSDVSKPRRSSLRDPKKPKTPPGTPTKKSVRFADALGLDLETVRSILEMDEATCVSPPLPLCVDYHDQSQLTKTVLRACFQQPGGRPDFLHRLYEQRVCLENVVVSDMTVIGTIKVRNLSFHKEVRVRYTWDDWTSHANIMAVYVLGSCDGPTDRFSFAFSVPRRHTGVGDKVFFAVFYRVSDQEYWDNNFGNNYFLLVDEIPAVK